MQQPRGLTFVDIFAGGGGLSLGLMQAGWRGLFAIEAEKLAFQTLKHNLVDLRREIRCRFIILARKDEPTPDYIHVLVNIRLTHT